MIVAIVGSLLAAAFLLWRLGRSGFHWERFRTTFTQLHLGWLSAGIVLILLTYVGRALRWQIMMRPFAPHANFPKLAYGDRNRIHGHCDFSDGPANLIRPYLIAVREKTPFSSQMAIWILERIWDLLIVLAMFGFALGQVHIDPSTFGPSMQWLLRTGRSSWAVLCPVCVVLLVMISIFSDVAQRESGMPCPQYRERYRGRVEDVLVAFAGGMQAHEAACLRFRFWCTVSRNGSSSSWPTWCLLRSFPQTSRFSIVDGAVFIGFVAFGSIVQIPGIGGGMQVASVVILTELFGVDLAGATGVAIVIWLTMYVFVAPIGVLLAVHEGLKWRS